MKEKKLRKYVGIITLLFFLIVFTPSALSQAEKTADSGTADTAAAGKTAAGVGVGTIAMGTAIAEAAVIALAASQPNSSNATTIR